MCIYVYVYIYVFQCHIEIHISAHDSWIISALRRNICLIIPYHCSLLDVEAFTEYISLLGSTHPATEETVNKSMYLSPLCILDVLRMLWYLV